MSRSLPRIFAVAPDGPDGSCIVVAAGRAGALGMLGFGIRSESAPIVEGARRVARYGDRPFGALLSLPMVLGLDWDAMPASFRVAAIVVGPGFNDAVASVVRNGRLAIGVVTSAEEADWALRTGASGLIASGLEAGGRCGSESSFVLLQHLLGKVEVPVWVRGGIGPRSAAACVAAGASGVVLDGALLLARESPLSGIDRDRVRASDGGDSVEVRSSEGVGVRVLAPPRSEAIERLRDAAERGGPSWLETVDARVGWGPGQLRPIGQDAAFAEGLALRFETVGAIVGAVDRAIDEHRDAARASRPLAEGSAMAGCLGTRYPILQGPMTRVSDVPGFAEAVARGGALPFLALALLRGDAVRELLAETSRRLGDRPWGVGLLGFNAPELRREQIEVVRSVRPPWALIAGGRPDQALELDREGIAAFLHAPSPALLDRFLREGARRFVLEGRECGGHVGPRSSLVLWEQAVEILEASIAGGVDPSTLHVAFAGGVHDARSAAAVAALAGPLAVKGVRIGVLAGTAYLFTQEAVATGAIVGRYQREALGCRGTVLLETGPGHLVRVGPSPYSERFEGERRRLRDEGHSADEVRTALERLNVGRLRIAAKGVDRPGGAGDPLVSISEDDQTDRGLYMLGQVAALRDRVDSIEDLHRDISDGSTALLGCSGPGAIAKPDRPERRPSDVAIIGMAAVMPGAGDLGTFWSNTLRGFDAITEVPPDRWDWRPYYDPDPKAPDKIVSKWGGFLPDIPFDPLAFGMPPSSLGSIEPSQLIALEVARRALADAGLDRRPFPRDRTAVVLGMGGGAAQGAMGYAFRSYLPMLDGVRPGLGAEALRDCEGLLPEWTEDSFPGFLLNVTAGRIANRLDLGGANYTVDAACGSSLAAASLAVRELETGAADVVLLGGVDTVQNPFTYLAFSKTHAFSPRGRCRPFDAGADGIVISEGAAAVVLKRLADAERDGDRVYAVIKGVGASSDGRARGLTAPDPQGQLRALHRAYEAADVSPSTVGYVEAHGTGTAVGDVVEVGALSEIFGGDDAELGRCGLGSVKSMIGHTKCAAGLAGLINASLALHHRVIPPTIGVERLNPRARLDGGPFRVDPSPRPWFHPPGGPPRRAGVSAFGFGGTNFHAVLEGYEGDPRLAPGAPLPDWPVELFLWRSTDAAALSDAISRLDEALAVGARPPLRDLAAALARDASVGLPAVLAIVAGSHDELIDRISIARDALDRGREELDDPRGVFLALRPRFTAGRLALVFPGQGAQAPGMLGELALHFDEVRIGFEAADAALRAEGRPPITPIVFPPPFQIDDHDAALAATEVAQPAVGAASAGLLSLLRGFGVEADAVAGHSFGELVALHASGAFDAGSLAVLGEARGRLIRDAVGDDPGAMAAVNAPPEDLEALLDGVAAVNFNGPRQTVIAGDAEAIERAVGRARDRGLAARRLAVSCAFHTTRVASASAPMADLAASHLNGGPLVPVYSNLDARPHPADPSAIARRLGDHLASPVRFDAMIAAMHNDGIRTFVEVGPGATLAPLIASILGDRPHLAVSCDGPGPGGLPALLRALGRLAASGVSIRLDRLFEGRSSATLDLESLDAVNLATAPTPSSWLVNGSRARPIDGPEPHRLGQAPELLGKRPEPTPEPPRTPDATSPTLNGHSVRQEARPSMPHPPEPAPRSVPHPNIPAVADRNRVMTAFQATMQSFLETQRAVMLAYLSGTPGTTSNGHSRSAAGNGAGEPNRNGFADRPFSHPKPTTQQPTPEPAVDQPPAPPLGQVNPIASPSMVPNPESRADQQTVEYSDSGTKNALDEAEIAARLVAIVRDRTGYPPEMLKLNLDLEADLGIDSIKRVEILGKLRDVVPALAILPDGRVMDALTRSRTLGAIVSEVAQLASIAANATPETEPKSSAQSDPTAKVRRLLLEPIAAPLPTGDGELLPGHAVLITDDGRGIARRLAERLEGEGRRAVLAGSVDWTSPSAVESLLGAVRRDGPIAAIVHLLPLRDRPPCGLDASAWADRIGPEVKGLFHLAKASAEDLDRASRDGGSCLLAASALGGSFGVGSGPGAEFFPGLGAVLGLTKTLAREWPSVRVRAVDLDPSEPVVTLADRLAVELDAPDGWAEVGYADGRRIRLRTKAAPIAVGGRLMLEPGAPVLVTGGARGITASASIALARRYRPTLLLLGTSPMPEPEEEPALARLVAVAELKAGLLDRLRRHGKPVGPSEVERHYRAILRDREIRRNLQAMRQAGATVDYVRADVRDADAVSRAIGDWRRRFGEPAGLIHGAGLIQDKLLRDKTPEAFDRVLSTKLGGALNLARLLRPDSLRFAAFFSSIAGRFGNAGQADYAAANEAINKLARWLDRRWRCRVVSLIWGPWSGLGMVSDLEEHLHRRGFGMIPPEIGAARFLEELEGGVKGEVEVILSGSLGDLEAPIARLAAPSPVGAAR